MSSYTLDSSCWIDVLFDRPGAESVARSIGTDDPDIVVPSTVLYEVRRWAILQGIDTLDVEAVCSSLENNHVVDLDAGIAKLAASTAVGTGLGFADAIILTTARLADAPLLTFDRDFEGLPGAIVLEHEN